MSIFLEVQPFPLGESHDNEMLIDIIIATFEKFGIRNKVGYFTHDRGSNLVAAGDKLVQQKGIEASANCFPHSINIVDYYY